MLIGLKDKEKGRRLELTNQNASVTGEEEKLVTNPVKAIRKHCLECCGGNQNEVKLCPAEACVLHPFRLGKNPYRTKREMTDEQRAAAAERLAKARQSREENN